MAPQELSFQFDTTEVSLRAFAVRRDRQRLNLEPKAVRVLIYLLQHRHRVVSKDELVAAVWEGSAVTDNAITRVVAQLRRELGDDSRSPKYIETYPTLGYRFIGEAREVAEAVPSPTPPAEPVAAPATGVGRRRLWPWALAGMVAAGAVGAWIVLPRGTEPSPAATATQVTTGRGVEVKPTFSPDGKAFAYSSNHTGRFEIYRRPLLSGGPIEPITADGRQNIQPAWSPDGKWIAYHSAAEHGIWVVASGGGTPRRLTKFGSMPAWSPDSRTLAFSSVEPHSLASFDTGGLGSIWTVTLADGTLREWTVQGSPPGRQLFPTWSHDGRRLAFATISQETMIHVLDLATGKPAPVMRVGVDLPRVPGTFVTRVWDLVYDAGDAHLYFCGESGKGEFFIWRIPAGGGTPAKVFASMDAPAGLSLSPDGSRLLFHRARNVSELWSVDETGATRPVFQDAVLRVTTPSYSPDGRWLVFGVNTQGRSRNLWIMPAGGGPAAPIDTEETQKEAGTVWTPGGELLYNDVKGGEVEFRAYDPVARRSRLIHRRTTKGLFHPALLPNARDLFASCSTPFNICVGPVTAPTLRQITFARESAWFAITDRRGEWIAYEAKRGDVDQIALVRADGTGGQVLGDAEGWNWPGDFSADGRRVVFAALRHGVWNLWWIDRVTGHRKQLTQETGFGPFVRSPVFRPGTNQVTYERFQIRSNIFALDLR